MRQRHRSFLSSASVLALVIALGAGTGAVASHLVVRRSDIVDNAINSRKVDNNTITGKDVKEASLATVPSAASLKGLKIVKFRELLHTSTEPAFVARSGPLVVQGTCEPADLATLDPGIRLRTDVNNAYILIAWQGFSEATSGSMSDVDFDTGESMSVDGGQRVITFVYGTPQGGVVTGTIAAGYDGYLTCPILGTMQGG